MAAIIILSNRGVVKLKSLSMSVMTGKIAFKLLLPHKI